MATIETTATRSKWTARTEVRLCHLVILRNDDAEVLVVNQNGPPSIPTLETPQKQRPAPHLISQIEQNWQVRAICRFHYFGTNPDVSYFFCDALDSPVPHDSGATWVSVEDIALFDGSCLDDFHGALRQAGAYRISSLPFARPGWFAEVTEWAEHQLVPFGLVLTRRWTQYNIGPAFALIRYETNKLPVWFKAVGEPNLHEYVITQELARLQSPRLPQVLATNADWHSWLMLDAGGHDLDNSASLAQWKTAARSLAELQIETIETSEGLLSAGCKDLRLPALRTRVEPFMDEVAELMALQAISPPRILDSNDLPFLLESLHHAIDEMESLAIPDTLGHSDLSPGNVQVNRGGAVFLDWAEGHIGHPFLTFEYMASLFDKFHPVQTEWRDQLRESYCEPWLGLIDRTRIVRALELAPLIAPFAFAVSWARGSAESMSSDIQKLIRSLARRMFAESQKLANR